MAATLEQFVANLIQSGLLTAGELAAFHETLPPDRRPNDPQALARELIHAGRLTKYQAAAVYQGKTKGLVLGDYVVLDEIGHGGMGQVFKAFHRTMERTVALKVLPRKAMRSPEAVERFHREVKAAARLEHPNIVTAHDAGEAEGIHFLVMQYVEGKDLAHLLAERGPLPPDEAVDYVVQAARGLEYAHRQGVVHRDIKPANLLLDQEGTVKVLDLGLARLEEAAGPTDRTAPDRLTETGHVMGSCDYMAPEQAEDSHRADHRADIYSLGCTLYRLLTGQEPYPGETPIKILLAHCQAPIPSLRDVRVDVSPELDAVFQKMLAKDPADRQQSMGEVIAELEGFLQPAPTSAPLPPVLEPPATASSSSSDSALGKFLRNVSKAATATPSPRVGGGGEETAHFEREKETGVVAAGKAPLQAADRKKIKLVGIGAGVAALLVILVLGIFLLRRGPGPEGPPEVARAKSTQEAVTEAPRPAVGKPESYLVLHCPEAERADAKLEIDDRPYDLSTAATASGPGEVKIAVPPGLHKVWIARRGFEPIEEEFTATAGHEHALRPAWQAAPPVVEQAKLKPEPEPMATKPGKPEPSQLATLPMPSEPEPDPKAPEPKAPEAPPLDPELQKHMEAEQRYAEALEPVEKLVAAWDFQAASAELERLHFDEADLAARLAAWRDGINRLADLKTRIIAKINTADPPLKKIDLLIRGMGGDLSGADQDGITAKLLAGKTETLTWADVGPKAIEKLIGLVSSPDNADDHLATGVLALASNDPTSAEKHFEKSRSLGADVGPYLAPLAAAALAKAQGLLAAEKFREAEALLANIEAKYAATPWFASNRAAFEAARANLRAGVRQAQAEKLYGEAVDLYKKEQLFDVRLIVEKLKAEYADSHLLTDAEREPSFGNLEKAVADLGQFITVRQDGKGDFTSIQAAIDRVPPHSLIEIQDNGPYNEKVEIPKEKEGLTLRGAKGAWPIVTSAGPRAGLNALVTIRAAKITMERILLVHSSPGASIPQ